MACVGGGDDRIRAGLDGGSSLSSSNIRSSRGEVGVDGRGDGWSIVTVNGAA